MAESRDEEVYVGGLVPTELRDQFKEIADRNERSFAAELRIAIRAHVAAQTQVDEAVAR